MLSRRLAGPTIVFFVAGLVAILLFGAVGGFHSYFYEHTKIHHHPVPPFQQVKDKSGRV